jgi:hypothetical protein
MGRSSGAGRRGSEVRAAGEAEARGGRGGMPREEEEDLTRDVLACLAAAAGGSGRATRRGRAMAASAIAEIKGVGTPATPAVPLQGTSANAKPKLRDGPKKAAVSGPPKGSEATETSARHEEAPVGRGPASSAVGAERGVGCALSGDTAVQGDGTNFTSSAHSKCFVLIYIYICLCASF